MDDDDQLAVDRVNALDATGLSVAESIVDQTVLAVQAARDAKVITAMDAGAVQVLLRQAERMDDPDFPYIEGKFDNVTEGLYAKLAADLGLTVGGRTRLPERKESTSGKLGQLRSLEGARRRSAG